MLMSIWKNLGPHTLLVRTENYMASLKNSLAVSQMLKLELSQDPAIPLLGIQHQDKWKTHIHTKACTWIFMAAWFVTAIRWKIKTKTSP